MSSTLCLESNCSNYLSTSLGHVFSNAVQAIFTAQCLINEDWPSDASDNITDLQFDYIIVGAGSAGSVLASRLTEDSCRRVLLIEAGGDPPLESVVPNGAGYLFGSKFDWQYQTEVDSHACLGSVGKRCTWTSGKMLGGGSSINGMVYIRGNPADYDAFATAGNYGWDYKEALKYFKKSERMTDSLIRNDPVLSKYHNFDGLLGVTSNEGIIKPLDDIILRGYNEIGLHLNVDINGVTQYGVTRAYFTILNGRRESTARAFLLPARNRKNLQVFKKALANKVLFDENTATGVEITLHNGTNIRLFAKKEVIISAGTIRTPQILMLSGIGKREQLEKYNIMPKVELSVGENLIDHVIVPFYIAINKDYTENVSQAIFDVAQYVTFNNGYYGSAVASEISYKTFFNSNMTIGSNDPPNIEMFHLYVPKNSSNICLMGAVLNNRICQSLLKQNEQNAVIIAQVILLNAKSRGSISLNSSKPSDFPKIRPNYFQNEQDIRAVYEAMGVMNKLLNTRSLQNAGAKLIHVEIPECDEFEFQSYAYWRCYSLYMNSPGLHSRGTSKMGPPSDENAVVDPYLRVYGVSNLRVVDASVIPGTIRGHTNVPVIMFAERAADLIKADNECPSNN